MKRKIRIGTRGSRLALWQANYTVAKLQETGIQAELVIIRTQGDKIQHLGFDKMEGKGFFTKEIEDALLEDKIDLAVHSMKDLSTAQPDGLVVAGVSERADPADALIMPLSATPTQGQWGLPENPHIGTSSARRKAQLGDILPQLRLEDIRGNVPTRLGKLESQGFDAIVLAMAGLDRLGIDKAAYRVIRLNPREFVPAPAQGVLAWQTRLEDKTLRRAILNLHQSDVAAQTNVERKVLRLLDGGCHMPLGVYCERDPNGNYHVWAAMADHWEGPLRTIQHSSSTSYELAEQVVEALKSPVT